MKKPIQVRTPSIKILLRKNVTRSVKGRALAVSERYAGQRSTIDLTPYLGDGGSVTVQKTVHDAAGGFSITFADQINQLAGDTVYGLVEPMDVVEIRMASDAYALKGDAPIMMRGIISEVRRTESVGGDGKPQRTVNLTGQDYGKLWQIYTISSMPYVDTSYNAISSLPFFAQHGQAINTSRAELFVSTVIKNILNPFVARFTGKTGALVPILTDGIHVRDGIVAPFGIYSRGGDYSLYSLLTDNCDIGAWNELFIEDREAGPCVVYRPNPYVSADRSRYIMPVVEKAEAVQVTRSKDIVSMTVSRSDANVANYWWVDGPRMQLNSDNIPRMMAFATDPANVYQTDYGNNTPSLYGLRVMHEATNQGGNNETSNGNGLPPSKQLVSEAASMAWVDIRRAQLRELNKDNVIFERGTIRLKGNELIRAGKYLRVASGNMTSDYYVTGVTHEYVQYGGYFTTATVERGTGFIDRVSRGGGSSSAYWSELLNKDE